MELVFGELIRLPTCRTRVAVLVAAAGVAVEDAQDLRRAARGSEGVRQHRGELGGLVGLDA
jgi:hypothetical protein